MLDKVVTSLYNESIYLNTLDTIENMLFLVKLIIYSNNPQNIFYLSFMISNNALVIQEFAHNMSYI